MFRATLVLILCAVVSSIAGGAVITVPSDHPTIKDAIAASAAGDTIVEAGVYVENVKIPVSRPHLKLIGKGKVVIDGRPFGAMDSGPPLRERESIRLIHALGLTRCCEAAAAAEFKDDGAKHSADSTVDTAAAAASGTS